MDTTQKPPGTSQTSTTSGNQDSDDDEQDQDEPSFSTQQDNKLSVEDELVTFRTKWQQEIQQPKVKPTSKQSRPSASPNEVPKYDNYSEEDIARNYFNKGADLEKAGKLYEAIQFYRKAVQLVPDIEYKLDSRPRQTVNETDIEHCEDAQEGDDDDSSEDDEPIEDGQLLPRIQKKVAKTGPFCVPKFEQTATHISVLPLELVLYILRWLVSTDLDLRSLEMFGSVCRGFYLCSRDSELWRLTCLRIWGLNCGPDPGVYGSWRNMFVERPRLNFNGCYISKTTYIRHGENSFQDQFYRPWHLVTYYRYLRFFPEGLVLMLTSPDDPAQCVAQMKSRTPRQPVMIGYYRLKDDKVTLVVQKQELTKSLQTTFKRSNRRREVDNSEQTFHMELTIQNHKERRHVKLTWSYYSVFTRTKQGHENTCNFDLKTNRFPPLWFSRVKSYTSESDQPLT